MTENYKLSQPELEYLIELCTRLAEGETDILHFYDYAKSGSSVPSHTIVIANIPDRIYKAASEPLEHQPQPPKGPKVDIGFVLCQIISSGHINMGVDVRSGAKSKRSEKRPVAPSYNSKPTVGDTVNCYFDSGELFAVIATIIGDNAIMVAKSGDQNTFFPINISDVYQGKGDTLTWGQE